MVVSMNKSLLNALYKLTASEPIQVFVYETLMNNKLRSRLLKRNSETHVDKLVGYREINVSTSEGENYHTLISDNDVVMGRRFFVSPEELRILDEYEDQYTRKKMPLQSGNTAWVYFLKVKSMKDMGHNLYVPNSEI
jgi:gamma-glutamylcyclotransferase (GGCT)/AIG2-like uncharacterized protein YtfP